MNLLRTAVPRLPVPRAKVNTNLAQHYHVTRGRARQVHCHSWLRLAERRAGVSIRPLRAVHFDWNRFTGLRNAVRGRRAVDDANLCNVHFNLQSSRSLSSAAYKIRRPAGRVAASKQQIDELLAPPCSAVQGT
jgi:hypothetical protein